MRSSFVGAVVISTMLIASPSSAQTKEDQREYDVTVVFIGLMSFDLGDNPQAGDPVTVIIPNLATGAKLQSGNADIPKHVTYLLASRDELPPYDPINRDYDFEETLHSSDDFIYLPFSGFHLSIDEENDVASLNSKLKYDNTGCGECPYDNGMDTNGKLCWLSSMKQVTGTTQLRDDAHFGRRAASKLSPKKVAARMVLRHGYLKAYVVGWPKGSPTAAKFEFYRPNNGGLILRQALAQETHWTFRARGVPFVINLQSVKPGGTNDRVAFMPTFPAEPNLPGTLTLIVGNTRAEEAGPMEAPKDPIDDMHYAAYYRFVKGNTDGAGPLPKPQKVNDEVVKCDQNVRYPILQTLFEAQLDNLELDRISSRALARRSMKADPRKSAHKKMTMYDDIPDPQPAPGGLNCSGNQWP